MHRINETTVPCPLQMWVRARALISGLAAVLLGATDDAKCCAQRNTLDRRYTPDMRNTPVPHVSRLGEDMAT